MLAFLLIITVAFEIVPVDIFHQVGIERDFRKKLFSKLVEYKLC